MRNGTSVISVLASRGRLGVAPPGVTTFYAMGTDTTPTLYKSTNGGLTWTANTGSAGAASNGRLAINPKGFMVDYRSNGNVYKSTNYGRTWDLFGNAGAPDTDNAKPEVFWDYNNGRFVFISATGRNCYLSTANSTTPTQLYTYTNSSVSGTVSFGVAPNMYLIGNTSSNGTPQLSMTRSANGSSFTTTTSSGPNGILGFAYSPTLNLLFALGQGTNTATARSYIISTITGRVDAYQTTMVFEGGVGKLFWSNVLGRFVRTNNNFSNTHASSRYIYLSEDGFNWDTVDLGSITGRQSGWAESNDELILFTTNNRIIRFTSPTSFSVINTGFSSHGGTCFIPE